MSVSRISTRYAKSLMDLAIERNELDAVKSDIDIFNKAMKSRDLYLMLKSPIINAAKKTDVMHVLFADTISKTTLAFFDIIVRKGREMYLPEIAADFILQYKIYNKISTVTVTTASPLSESSLSDIKSRLLESHITMDKLDVITKVDPTLLGGFIIEVGDRLYDASIAHRLEIFKKEFAYNQFVKSF